MGRRRWEGKGGGEGGDEAEAGVMGSEILSRARRAQIRNHLPKFCRAHDAPEI
jgi:hypothetical protein